MVYVINNEHLTRRKLVTIDGSKVTTEIDIPLGLNINLSGVKAAGADVRLTKLDGTPIAREIECKDVPNSDDVTIWYQWNTTATQNDQFYVYWGNSNLTEPAEDATYGREAVWDSNYVGVWHMNNDPTGTIIDSTSNDNDATSVGTMISGDLINGNYCKGINFDGVDDWLVVPYSASLSTAEWTIMAQIKSPSYNTEYQCILSRGSHLDTYRNYQFAIASTASLYGMYEDTSGTDAVGTVGGSFTNNVEYTVGYTLTYPTTRTYQNGVQVDSQTQSIVPKTAQTSNLSIGEYIRDAGTGHTWEYGGDMYEVRLSDIERSANYQLTTHKNITNPSASGTTPFYLSFSPTQHQRRTPQFIG